MNLICHLFENEHLILLWSRVEICTSFSPNWSVHTHALSRVCGQTHWWVSSLDFFGEAGQFIYLLNNDLKDNWTVNHKYLGVCDVDGTLVDFIFDLRKRHNPRVRYPRCWKNELESWFKFRYLPSNSDIYRTANLRIEVLPILSQSEVHRVLMLVYSQASTELQKILWVFTGPVLTLTIVSRTDLCEFALSLSPRPFPGDAIKEFTTSDSGNRDSEQPRRHEHCYKK